MNNNKSLLGKCEQHAEDNSRQQQQQQKKYQQIDSMNVSFFLFLIC